MRKLKYQDGQKFGDITLLNRVISKAGKGLFLCYCGVEFETRIDAIVSGHTKSCGCYYNQTRPQIKNIYEIGEQIGTCFYMGDASYKSGNPRRATFRCFCGNYFITAIQNLDNGTTKSCGCSTSQFQSQAGSLPSKEMPQLSQDDIDRFWGMVSVKNNKEECWNWMFSGQRYGNFSLRGKSYKASRLAYFISTGIDPKEMEVMHSCDNTKCCNPTHLSLGTHLENMQDMAEKGRAKNNNRISNI